MFKNTSVRYVAKIITKPMVWEHIISEAMYGRKDSNQYPSKVVSYKLLLKQKSALLITAFIECQNLHNYQ